jgi:excisionase family DNA binding protein
MRPSDTKRDALIPEGHEVYLYHTDEAARVLAISRATLYRHIQNGVIATTDVSVVGRSAGRISAFEIVRFIQTRTRRVDPNK